MQTCKIQGLFRKGLIQCNSPHYLYIYWVSLNPFPNKPWFLRVCSASFLKTLWEKEKLLVKSNFSFSHSVFYQSGELSAIVIKFEIIVCKLFQFGKSLKFVIWERVKDIFSFSQQCFQKASLLGSSKVRIVW